MRHVLALLAAAVVTAPLVAQQPGRGPGTPLPEHWVSFDSLAQAVHLNDEQRAAAQALHGRIDSIVRRGAAVRGEMRQEMQRNPDREQARRYFERLQTMQQAADRLMNDLRAGLTEEQKASLDAVRAPLVAPQRPQGGRRPGN